MRLALPSAAPLVTGVLVLAIGVLVTGVLALALVTEVLALVPGVLALVTAALVIGAFFAGDGVLAVKSGLLDSELELEVGD